MPRGYNGQKVLQVAPDLPFFGRPRGLIA